MNNIDLTIPNRQSAKGLVVILIDSIINFLRRGFIPIAAVAYTGSRSIDSQYLIYAGIALFVLIIVHSILYYLNFYFYIKNDEFVLKKGYLQKKILSIPLDRIQNLARRKQRDHVPRHRGGPCEHDLLRL